MTKAPIIPTQQSINYTNVRLYDHTCISILWPSVGVCFAAYAIRLALTRGDLWGDEAASVTLSLQPLSAILATLARAEPHPPLYPVLLKLWMRLVGTDEMLVRLPSIFASTALAATCIAIGRTVTGRVGVTAGLLVAISPFLIWYSTESRMYTFAALGAALSFLSFARLIKGPRRATIAAFGGSLAFGLLSHYFVLFVAFALGLISLRVMYNDRRLIQPIATGWMLGFAPFVAWGVIASQIIGGYHGAARGTIDIPAIAIRAFTRMGAGWSIDPAPATVIGLVSGLVLVASLISYRSVRLIRWSGLWLVSVFLIPAAISVVRPMYQERYLIVAAPAYLLILAVFVGLTQRRLLRASFLYGAVAIALIPIANMANGSYIRSQYGSHTREVNALGTANEAVILNGPSQYPLYSYYASRGGIGLPVFALPHAAPAPEPDTSNELSGITDRFSGVWLFLYAVDDYDPAQIIEQWLNAHSFRAPPRWTVNGRLIRYVTEHVVDLNPLSSAQTIAKGWSIAAALPRGAISAGSLVPIEVHISTDATVTSMPKLRLRLIDERGFLWGEADEPLGSGFVPVTQLFTSGTRIERRAIGVASGAATGPLRLEAHLYHEDASGSLAIGTVNLGTVNIQSSERFWNDQIAGLVPGADRVADLTMIGSSVASARRTGERAYVTTFWRANTENRGFDQLTRLTDARGNVVSTRRQSIGSEQTLVARGHIRRIQVGPAIGANWQLGEYQVQIGVARAGNTNPEVWANGKQWHDIGLVHITMGTQLPGPSPAENAVDIRFGGAIQLVGFSVARNPGAVTLQWRAASDIDRPWTVFVHAVNQAGTIVAQSDGQPAAGNSPMDGWSVGDVVDDRHTIDLPISDCTTHLQEKDSPSRPTPDKALATP